MKHHEIDQPLNPLRRKLLLGLPSGLALSTPLALIGCGGGGDDGGSTEAASDNSLHDSGRAFAGDTGFTEVTVGVELPAGVTVPAGGLAAHTLLGGFGVMSAGTATLRVAFAGPQLATLYTADKLPLLFGFVGDGLPPLSARSTATALIAFALGTEWVEGSTSRAWIAEVHASTAAATLADVIAAELAADVYAVAGSNRAIDAALVDAVRTLLPAAATATPSAERARPYGIGVNPPNPASGVQPVIAEALNTIYVQNEKLRRAWYVVHREGHVAADGSVVPDAGRTVVVSGDIPMLPAFDSASSIIGSVTTALYAGDDTGLAFSKTAETTLVLSPEGARNTNFSTTVLMAGNSKLGYDQAAFDKLTYEEKLKIDISLFSPENLGLQTLMIDLLMPMFMSWLGGKVSDVGGGAGPREWKQKLQIALMGQLLGVLSTTLPPIVAKLKDTKTYPEYGVVAALTEIARTHLVVFVDVPVPGRAQPVSLPALSKFSISMLLLLLKYIAYEKLSVANGEALLNFLEGDANDAGERKYSWNVGKGADGKDKLVHFDKENLAFAGIGVAMKALGTVDTILGNVGKLRAAIDIGSSKLLETWDVKVTKPKLRLNPAPFEVKDTGVVYPIKAEIVDNDNDIYGNEKGSFRFDWVCTGLYGDLFKRNGVDGAAQEKNRFSTSNANATTDYLATTLDDGAGPETITVTAYFEPIGSGKPAELIGTVSSTVNFKKPFNLRINPPGPTDVPNDTDFGLIAAFKENVPYGSTVAWTWSHSGVGSLAEVAADSNPADSQVTFKSGANEGASTVTVRATLSVPAAYGMPARTFECQPVSTTLNVKKGLKTLKLTGGWTIDTTYEPYVCGRCGPGGSPTNETGFSVAAYVVIPKVAGAKSYSVLLESPTPDVRGGVPFPSTRGFTPTSLGSVIDKGGVYWSGLSGLSGTVSRETGGGPDSGYTWMNGRFGAMTVTVTVTL